NYEIIYLIKKKSWYPSGRRLFFIFKNIGIISLKWSQDSETLYREIVLGRKSDRQALNGACFFIGC
ncbi:MAG: hypothetical protein ABEJ02_01035, partial [Candidatus Paceibacteria bacterium]